MREVEVKLRAGMTRQGITGAPADAIVHAITSFALYGFPECVVGDTRIIDVDTGRWVRIEDVVSGRVGFAHTLACDSELTLRPRRVIDATFSGRRMVYRLKTALGRELLATPEHPLLTVNGWRPLGSLRAGDHVAVARALPCPGRQHWPRHHLVVLAGLIAEGNVCHPSTVYFYTTDPDYRDEYVSAVEQFDNTCASVARHRGCYSVHVRRARRDQPNGLVEWVKYLGVWGLNARAKHLPDAVFELHEADCALLLARLWEGDGSLSRVGHASYETASRRLAEDIQHLLLRLGIVSRRYERKRPYRGREVMSWVVCVTGQDVRQFDRVIASQFLHPGKRRMAAAIAESAGKGRSSRDVIPVAVRELVDGVRRRHEMTWEGMGRNVGLSARTLGFPCRSKRGYRRWVIERLAETFRSPELRRLAKSGLYWDRVVAVEPVGERDTYDLHVETDHNFVANDLIVHNSHAASFALLAYASAYLKAHHPAAFYAALLNNQPMGFYHPATVVRDAERHGQAMRPADVNASDWLCTIEADGAVRLGLRYVKGLREEAGKRVEAERRRRPFASVEDLAGRTDLRHDELRNLAQVGALASLRPGRRAALWEAERAVRPRGPLYGAIEDPPDPSPLRTMTSAEEVVADYEGTGLSLGPHPMRFHRARLVRLGVARAVDLAAIRDGARVRVAGAVVVRQRPGTAKGIVFLNLEDETGIVSVVVYPDLFRRHRLTLVEEPFLYVEGRLQHQDNVTSVLASHLASLGRRLTGVPSHDFH